MKTKYDGFMDFMCIPLCDAMNEIPGIRTTASCSGHNLKPMQIWFECKKLEDVFVLVRCLDIRYGAPKEGWKCCITATDLPEKRLSFHVESRSKGEKAFKESQCIAELIYATLKNKAVQRLFGIKYGRSSVGRTAVSKTVGRRFKSCRPCQKL